MPKQSPVRSPYRRSSCVLQVVSPPLFSWICSFFLPAVTSCRHCRCHCNRCCFHAMCKRSTAVRAAAAVTAAAGSGWRKEARTNPIPSEAYLQMTVIYEKQLFRTIGTPCCVIINVCWSFDWTKKVCIPLNFWAPSDDQQIFVSLF